MPNVSGGLVISSIPQRTEWSLDCNIRLAQTAERVGFEYALSKVRYASSYGAAQQHECAELRWPDRQRRWDPHVVAVVVTT